MKKLLFIALAGVVALASCNKEPNNSSHTQPKLSLMASLPYKSANVEKTPMAGVVEGNTSYTAGERFYWHSTDQITVTAAGERLWYNAEAFDDSQKLNSIAFVYDFSSGILPNNSYNIRAYYGNWGDLLTPPSTTVGNEYMQRGSSTEHLSGVLPMYADGTMDYQAHMEGDEVIVDKADISHLSFTQLGGLLRASVLNASSVASLQVTSLTFAYKGSNASQLYTTADLVPGATELSNLGGEEPYIKVNVSNGTFNEQNIDGLKKVFDVYAPVLPSEGYTDPADQFEITTTYTDSDGKLYYSKHSYNCADVPFLVGGFKKGERYLFKIKVTNDNLVKQADLTYSLGDYYPFPGMPTQAEGIVFEIDGTGKIGKAMIPLFGWVEYSWGPMGIQEATACSFNGSQDDGYHDTYALLSTRGDDLPNKYQLFLFLDDYYSPTWYLPAVNELTSVYSLYSSNPTQLNNSLTTAWGSENSLSSLPYLTINEGNFTQVWAVDFSTGNSELLDKNVTTRAIIIRKF